MHTRFSATANSNSICTYQHIYTHAYVHPSMRILQRQAIQPHNTSRERIAHRLSIRSHFPSVASALAVTYSAPYKHIDIHMHQCDNLHMLKQGLPTISSQTRGTHQLQLEFHIGDIPSHHPTTYCDTPAQPSTHTSRCIQPIMPIRSDTRSIPARMHSSPESSPPAQHMYSFRVRPTARRLPSAPSSRPGVS